jgi:hypothetical protein
LQEHLIPVGHLKGKFFSLISWEKKMKVQPFNKYPILIVLCSMFFMQAERIHAASQAGVLFLDISPSVQANGMGNTYETLASIDPMASIFNPAYLGFYAKNNRFGISSSRAKWLPQLVSDMHYSCYSFVLGYQFKKKPLSFGMAYHRIFLDFGENVYTGESGPEILGIFHSWDKADMFSMSLLYDYSIQASIGISYKFIDSHLAPMGYGPVEATGTTTANAFNYGLAIQIPVVDIISKATKQPIQLFHVTPTIQPGFSYGVTNIGRKIAYIDDAQADPLPRTAYIGFSCSIGMKYSEAGFNFNLISLNYANEATGELIAGYYDSEGWKTRYLSSFFDVNKKDIIYKNGWELRVLDAVFIRGGHFNDTEGRRIYDTEGYGINFMQFVKYVDTINKNSFLKQFIQKIDVEYHYSKCLTEKGHPLTHTQFNGISIRVRI